MAWGPAERRFARDAALVAVTAGLYFVYWAWRANRDLARWFPERRWLDNGAFLVLGGLVGTLARLLLEPRAPPVFVALVSVAGVAILSLGLLLLTQHLQQACAVVHLARADPPWLFPGAVALAFAGVEAGNAVEDLVLRGIVLALLASLPYLYYRTHRDMQRLRDHIGAAPTS